MTSKAVINGPWINVWRDPVVNLKAYNNGITLADLSGDGDSQLIIADIEQAKIVSYKGVKIEWQSALTDTPIALATFYSDQISPPRPVVAVAVDSFIFLYRNFKPSFRFPLPRIEPDEKQAAIWKRYDGDANNLKAFLQQLEALKQKDFPLSQRSLELLSMTNIKKQYDVSKMYKNDEISSLDTVVAMKTLKKSSEDDFAVSHLVVATEFQRIYILDRNGEVIEKKFQISGTPAFLQTVGVIDTEYRIFIATRQNSIIIVRNGEIEPGQISLISQPVGLIYLERALIVATMNESFSSYTLKGTQSYTIKVNANITALCSMQYGKGQTIKCTLIALDNYELRIYQLKDQIHQLKVDGVVMGMQFGIFGREDGACIMIYKNQGIDVKMLQRTFNPNTSMISNNSPDDEELKLNIPQKTKLFIQEAQREKENPISIHRGFQKDLMRLRVKVSKQYLNLLEDGTVQTTTSQENNLRILANVSGLGPLFKIQFSVENLGSQLLANLIIAYNYDDKIFQLNKPVSVIPILVPHVSLPLEVCVQNIDPNGSSDIIRIIICERDQSIPLIGAIVQLPLSEIRL